MNKLIASPVAVQPVAYKAVFKIFAGIVLIVAGVLLTPIIGPLALNLIAIGVSLVVQGVIQAIRGGGSGTKNDIAKVNVRIAEPIRWIASGRNRLGGAVLFAEFDGSGNLWYLVVHSDSILTSNIGYLLDDIAVTVDGSGRVLTKDFRLNSKKEPVTADGAGDPYVQVWTTTYTESNPTPPAVTALAAAFPAQWTSDHKLIGTTYSVVKMTALKAEDRGKIYKWRGPLGLGEPSVALIGIWSNAFDPRDDDQVSGDRSTYLSTRNSVLAWAWFRTHRYGRNKSQDSINWDRVAEQAAICDETVTGIEGDHVRYQCDVTIPEDRTRIDAEQEILMTADAQLVFDNDGKCWPRVGKYETPSLVLTRNRDIVAMESIEAQDGESETQGVIVRYTDPDVKYIVQPSAAWYNPLYYNEGEAATFLTVDIPAIQDHNQAMRIAKAIGMRSQPAYKLAPTTGLRGLKARQERFVNLLYDNTFAGDHEIASQVQVDPVGVFCGFQLVPVDADRWDLLPGEERTKGGLGGFYDYGDPDLPTGVDIYYANGRIEAVFDAPTRDDITYEFEYIPTADIATNNWADMTVKMVNLFAYSGSTTPNTEYTVRYRAISISGRVSDWSTPESVNALPNNGDLQQTVFSSFIVEAMGGVPVVSIAADGTLTIDNHTRRYSDGHADVAVTGATISTGLAAGIFRAIGYDDPTRVGGAVTYNLYAVTQDAQASPANPGRHFVGYFVVPSTGTSDGDGGGFGGYCVQADTLILLADGTEIPADRLTVGDLVRTQHEHTLEWGDFPILAITLVEADIYRAAGYPNATANHRFWIGDAWAMMHEIGEMCGTGLVAKITVETAHTYVSAGVLSHNVKDYY